MIKKLVFGAAVVLLALTSPTMAGNFGHGGGGSWHPSGGGGGWHPSGGSAPHSHDWHPSGGGGGGSHSWAWSSSHSSASASATASGGGAGFSIGPVIVLSGISVRPTETPYEEAQVDYVAPVKCPVHMRMTRRGCSLGSYGGAQPKTAIASVKQPSQAVSIKPSTATKKVKKIFANYVN